MTHGKPNVFQGKIVGVPCIQGRSINNLQRDGVRDPMCPSHTLQLRTCWQFLHVNHTHTLLFPGLFMVVRGCGFCGWGFQLLEFGAYGVGPSGFFGVRALFINIEEKPWEQNFAVHMH